MRSRLSTSIFGFLSLLVANPPAGAANKAPSPAEEAYRENLSQAVTIYRKSAATFKKSKDAGTVITTLREHKIAVAPDAQMFLVTEIHQAAPKISVLGRQLIFSFKNNEKLSLELSPQSKHVLLVNGAAIDVANLHSLKEIKKALALHFKRAGGQASASQRFLENLILPRAHADLSQTISNYGGWIVMGAGLILAMNDNKAIGLALIAGGGLYQVIKTKDEKGQQAPSSH